MVIQANSSVMLGPCICPPLLEQMPGGGVTARYRLLARETSIKLCNVRARLCPLQTAGAAEWYSIHDALVSLALGTLTLKDWVVMLALYATQAWLPFRAGVSHQSPLSPLKSNKYSNGGGEGLRKRRAKISH